MKGWRGEFVFVKGGCYRMGDTFADRRSDELPVHEVCVDDFYLGKYEVTQGQWKALMGNNPSDHKGDDNYPVEKVSWNDVQDFIRKLNDKTGQSIGCRRRRNGRCGPAAGEAGKVFRRRRR